MALLWLRPTEPEPVSSGALAGGLEIPLPELEDLAPGELDSVLSAMDEPLAADSLEESPELESVLDIWEG